MSSSFPHSRWLPGAITGSATRILPFSFMARRPFVSIAAVRNRLEEIARFESAPSGESRGGDMTIVLGSGDDGRQIEQHAFEAPVLGEDGGEPPPAAARHIDEGPDASPLVGLLERLGDRRILDARQAGHRLAENLEVVWVIFQVVVKRLSEDPLRREFSRLYRVEDVCPRVLDADLRRDQ